MHARTSAADASGRAASWMSAMSQSITSSAFLTESRRSSPPSKHRTGMGQGTRSHAARVWSLTTNAISSTPPAHNARTQRRMGVMPHSGRISLSCPMRADAPAHSSTAVVFIRLL